MYLPSDVKMDIDKLEYPLKTDKGSEGLDTMPCDTQLQLLVNKRQQRKRLFQMTSRAAAKWELDNQNVHVSSK